MSSDNDDDVNCHDGGYSGGSGGNMSIHKKKVVLELLWVSNEV